MNFDFVFDTSLRGMTALNRLPSVSGRLRKESGGGVELAAGVPSVTTAICLWLDKH